MQLSMTAHSRYSLIRCFGGLLTILLFALCSCTADCPTRNDVTTLDLNQLSGKWFLVAGTPATGKSMSKCGKFFVSKSTSDSFVMNYTAVTHLFNKPVGLILNAKLEEDIVGNMQLRGSNKTLGPYKLRIVAVDYDSYFVIAICATKNTHKDFSMILSRDTAISSTTLERLKNQLSFYFNRDSIVDVEHSNC